MLVEEDRLLPLSLEDILEGDISKFRERRKNIQIMHACETFWLAWAALSEEEFSWTAYT